MNKEKNILPNEICSQNANSLCAPNTQHVPNKQNAPNAPKLQPRNNPLNVPKLSIVAPVELEI